MLVFISYHTPDRDKAQALEAALAMRRPGNEWYLAPRNMAGGAWWMPSLADAITRADAVLFLAGRRIGPWQELEYYEALRLSREKAGRPRVVPVVIADQAPGLPFFAQLHQIFAPDPSAPETLEAIERALDNSLPPDTSPAWQRFQPYKGLPALEEADAAFFFGRDDETAEILDLMPRRPDRIIALIGQSGVGKSSLARAGVLARLKSQLWPLAAGAWPAGLRESRAFLPLVVRPGEQPLKELALAFAQLYCTRSFELDEEAAGWARRFADGARLSDMLRATRDKLAQALDAEPPKRFVVYLDQGEELYTRAGPDEARRFSALVAEAAGHEAFSVLMSLRSDYYTAYQNDRAVFDASEHVDVLPLTREVLGEVIRKPALSLGAHFESDDMAGRVAEATEREPGALPLLSDLMHEMWLHMQARGDGVLRWSDNPEIVDVAAPLRRRAEAFLADSANDEAVLRRLLTLRLAHVPEAGDPVRRRARRSECSAAEWAVAQRLAEQDWRLLTLARAADGEPLAEVAHEQLLQRWPRLKAWLGEEREFLVWKGQIEHAAAAYAELPEAERDGALLMGRPLVIARGWFERRGEDLAFEVRAFLERSIWRHDALEAERVETERRLNESELNREREARERAEEAQRAALRLGGRTRMGALVVSILFVIAAAVGAYAVRAERTAQDELSQTQVAQSRLLAAQSQQQLEAGNGGTALALALEALPTDKEKPERPDIPEAEGAAFGALLGLRELTVLSGHEDALQDAAFSPDGTRVVTASDDGTARIWDAVTGKETMRLQAHKGVVRSAAFSPDGKVIITAVGKTALLWDVATGTELAQLVHERVLDSVRFSRDGRLVVTASKSGEASIWDVAAAKIIANVNTCRGDGCTHPGSEGFNYADFSSDGRLVVTASDNGIIRIWSVATSEQMAQFACDSIAWQAIFSPDGKTVVGACGGPRGDRAARIWDLETRKEVATLHHEDGVSSAAFSADGRSLVTASFDASASIWDVATKVQIGVLRGHSSSVMSAAFSPDGNRVVTASVDKTARIWNVTPAKDVVTMRGHEGFVTGVDFDADGARVVTASEDGTARIWDPASGRELMALPAAKSGDFIRRAVFSSDGTRIATASSDGMARIWDAKTGKQILELAHDQPLWRVRFNADGSRVVTAAEDGTAHIWDAQTGKELRVLHGAGKRMYDAAFDREGALLILASEGGSAIWDASTGERKVELRGNPFSYGAAFSRDGKRVVTAGADGTVAIWDTASGRMLVPLIGHHGQVLAAAFSPDDRRVVSASLDRTARIWDAETGHEIFRIEGGDRLYDAVFSPDGRRIVVASADKTATVWPVPDGAPRGVVDTALNKAPRCLAPEERARFFLSPESPEWCRRLAKWPYDAGSYEMRGRQLRRDRAYAEAIVEFNEALRLDPSRQPRIASDLASSYNGKAWDLFEKAAYAEGLANANHAVELAPDNWAILDTRGQIFFALEKYDDAFSDLSKSVDKGAEDPITFYTLGRIYERRGQREPTIADYRKALELDARGDDTNKRAQEQARERLTALGVLAKAAD